MNTNIENDLEANILQIDGFDEEQYFEAANERGVLQEMLNDLSGSDNVQVWDEDDIEERFLDMLDEVNPTMQIGSSEVFASDVFKMYDKHYQSVLIADYRNNNFREICDGIYMDEDDYYMYVEKDGEQTDIEEFKSAFLKSTGLQEAYEKATITEALAEHLSPKECMGQDTEDQEQSYTEERAQRRARAM